MALVGYSDSEDSDTEAPPPVAAPKVPAATKSSVEKLISTSGPRKIKVDLPAVSASASFPPTDRPAKKARTGGAFSDFNALLPKPKRADAGKKAGLGAGFSLKTSSAAAFSREPVVIPEPTEASETGEVSTTSKEETSVLPPVEEPETKAAEAKIVGNAMRFRPLSVANNKKKPKRPVVSSAASSTPPKLSQSSTLAAAAAPPPKPAISLYSMSNAATTTAANPTGGSYVPMLEPDEDEGPEEGSTLPEQGITGSSADTNPLSMVANDLNLSDADRRRLFGRAGKDGPVNITNFNMDNEYRRNEALRASGEAVQHNAVRAIGSGKHSLQSLVNASVGQRDALEDKWAEGRRNRGEAGNKYGW